MNTLKAGRDRSRGDARAHVAAAHAGKGQGPLLRIALFSLRHPWQASIAIGATIVAATLQLMIPRLLGQAVDQAQNVLSVAEAGAEQALWLTAMTLLGVSVARGVFTLLQNYFSESVGHHVGYELRLAFYDKVQRLSYAYHDRVHSGDLITMGLLDLDGVRMFFSTGLIRVVLLSVLIGVGAWMLFTTDVLLAFLALSFVPFVAWRSSVAQLTLRNTWLVLQQKLSVLTRVMEENLGGIRVVRAFAGQKFEMGKFETASHDALDLAHERVNVRVRNTSMMTFSFFAAMGLVLWVGGSKVIAGEMSVGTLASFLTFMTILQMPVRQLGLMVNSFARASICGDRFYAFLDQAVDIEDRPGAVPLKVSEGTLRFEDVHFTYPGASVPTLNGVTFEGRVGQTIGIVGAPGSGKSTLAHLIPRFYDVTSGRITLDGQDVSAVTLESLRRSVAVVQQDTFLFTTTIENNIAYGDPWAKDRKIERAAESAQLHNYIMGLPGDYDTVVGERGVSLSGGQRQRLSIARSLVLKPAVMVFDDSTAAIDAGTEHRIRSAIRRFAKDRVTIIIAHRLSSLMHADMILFLEDGRVVERGTHAQLLEQNGRYRALYDLQTRPGDDLEAAE
ncbi:MAG: ABC transporter ATP-binding protein [Devosia sp.]|uniref:ABC transporter ATP-binding protein n=1 Tax=Devosia sp. TaxID=1871048 RepID=UPI0024CA5B2A|nr:ABC transporter ATP-binding protein [Devosia sp.]UYN99261.1 MAG: ABC transporter ATP-binding protein [Devosia sp.]